MMNLFVLFLSTVSSLSLTQPPSSIGTLANPFNTLHDSQLGQVVYAHKFFQTPENLLIAIPKYLLTRRARPEKYPVVMFFSGFGSNIPTEAYHDVLAQMASKGDGAVFVAWDGLTIANPLDMDNMVVRVTNILEYLTSDLGNFIAKNFKEPVQVDMSQVFFAGHSSGSQIATLMALKVRAKGLILLDPVDSDPVKLTTPVVHAAMNFTNPVLVVDSGKCLEGNPACCPAGFSGQHFYDGFETSQKFKLTASLYGHSDLLGPDNLAYGTTLNGL
jgi:Chlorophyllase enzyme